MEKILSILTGGLIKDLGKLIDDLTTTKEEKLEANRLMQEMISKAEATAQEQVSNRWESDMRSDSWLSKNIRPAVLVFLTVVFSILAFFDGNIGEFSIAESYIPVFQTLLITVYGAYFAGRSIEKIKFNNKS